jgi:hypothetical protein
MSNEKDFKYTFGGSIAMLNQAIAGYMEANGTLGCLGDYQYDSGIELLNAVSHNVMSFDTDKMTVKIKILSTPRGQLLQEIVDAEVQLKPRLVMDGKVDADGEVISITLRRVDLDRMDNGEI